MLEEPLQVLSAEEDLLECDLSVTAREEILSSSSCMACEILLSDPFGQWLRWLVLSCAWACTGAGA